MPQLPQTFNARTIEPAVIGASQLPVSPKEGWPVVITASEMKATFSNAQNGMLVFTIMIIDGEHKGDEGTYRLNLYHENLKTVEIANRKLSALCWVVGKPDAKVSEELHNIPFRAVVTLQLVKQDDEDKGYTEIKGVLDINSNAPGKTGSAPPPAPAPTQAPAFAPAPVAQPATQPVWGQPAANSAPAWGAPAAEAAPAPPPWASKPQ